MKEDAKAARLEYQELRRYKINKKLLTGLSVN